MTTVFIEVMVNEAEEEAWHIIDEWMGRTAPFEVVEFTITDTERQERDDW